MPYGNEFKVNAYLTLKLEYGITNIYIAGKRFNQCKYLLLSFPVSEIEALDELDSIDEAAEILDHSLERSAGYQYDIPPETEFWAHCSNIQAWYENDYDTRLLHRNLSFALLKRLTEVGDKKARNAFKDEIFNRYKSDFLPVKLYIIENNYLVFLTKEELRATVTLEELENIRLKFREDLKLSIIIAIRYKDLEGIDKALQIVDSIRKKESKDWHVWYITASFYYDLYFEQAYTLNTDHKIPPRECLNLAIKALKYSLELNPDNVVSLTRLGEFLTKKRENNEAKYYLKKSLKLNSKFVETWLRLGIVYTEMKRYDKALDAYDVVMQNAPNNQYVCGVIADVYLHQKDFKKALIWSKKQLNRNPHHYEALFFLGKSYYKLGNYHSAISMLNKALQCDYWFKARFTLTDLEIWKTLSKAYLKSDYYKESLSIIKKVLMVEPDNLKYQELLKDMKKM